MLAHSVNVGNHDPIIGIDEQLHKPTIDLIGMDIAKQHKVPKHHQPFYMVTICMLQSTFDTLVKGNNACRAGVEGSWQRLLKIPCIGGSLPRASMDVNEPNELAPADNLPQESFQ